MSTSIARSFPHQRRDCHREADAQVLPKTNMYVFCASAFDHDDVRHPARDDQVAGQRRTQPEADQAIQRQHIDAIHRNQDGVADVLTDNPLAATTSALAAW
jgi:hypothetical protein